MDASNLSNLEILSKLKDPTLIHTLSLGDKFQGALMVTLLGMGITFSALILIRYLTSLLSYVVMKIENKNKPDVKVVSTTNADVVEEVLEEGDDEELIAVISAAIAASLNTSIHNIIVRNIVRTEDSTPAWGQAGRMQQLNNTIIR
ncbi:MAG: OadG family protein [Acidaminobacteraceae bacterium]